MQLKKRYKSRVLDEEERRKLGKKLKYLSSFHLAWAHFNVKQI